MKLQTGMVIKITQTLVSDDYVFEFNQRTVLDWFGMYITITFVKRILVTVVVYYYIAVIHDYFESHTSIKKLG